MITLCIKRWVYLKYHSRKCGTFGTITSCFGVECHMVTSKTKHINGQICIYLLIYDYLCRQIHNKRKEL